MKKRIMAAVLALLMVLTVTGVPAEAVRIGHVLDDRSQTFTGKKGTVEAVMYYDRVYLDGTEAGTAAVNKALKKLSNAFFKNGSADGFFGYAKTSAEEGPVYADDNKEQYFNCVNGAVTYADGEIVSVVNTNYWYAGGVTNHLYTTANYNILTGKKISIQKATGMKASAIKEAVLAELAKLEISTGTAEGMKVKNYKFTINSKDEVTVYFDSYEVDQGPMGVEITIPRVSN